jgi:hypothetical protein
MALLRIKVSYFMCLLPTGRILGHNSACTIVQGCGACHLFTVAPGWPGAVSHALASSKWKINLGLKPRGGPSILDTESQLYFQSFPFFYLLLPCLLLFQYIRAFGSRWTDVLTSHPWIGNIRTKKAPWTRPARSCNLRAGRNKIVRHCSLAPRSGSCKLLSRSLC